MSADIMTALPELPPPCDFAYVQGFKGSECRRLSGYEPKSAMYSPDQMRAYAERAVLEAAPASSAMAMQAVDADSKRLDFLLSKMTEGHLNALLGGGYRMIFTTACARSAIDHVMTKLQSQQSPVQASEDKRQQEGEAINKFFSQVDNRDGTFAFDPYDANDVDLLINAIKASDAGMQG